ncbi:hypothetical protein [Desulfopila sp. IMCC35008]|uniref:hypothetical protein n=1 Tax=Desulfopila sp. IMCC35008 TaxID=2653858 RepID=UPI0013D635D7|nr:hypothetical protein [Desulfopila sp. IMCC35008]
MVTTDGNNLELLKRIARLERQVSFLLAHLGLEYNDDMESSAEIVELVRLGKKNEAIKQFREETGVDQQMAEQIISKLER